MEELHLIVHGKVQGVWFRAWTREKARDLGVTGWVRNTDEGTVEIVAQGSTTAMEQLREYVSEGPPQARVNRIEASWQDKQEPFATFEVRS